MSRKKNKFNSAELNTLSANYKSDSFLPENPNFFQGMPKAKWVYNYIVNLFGEAPGKIGKESWYWTETEQESIISICKSYGYKIKEEEYYRYNSMFSNTSDLKSRLEREHRVRLAKRLGLRYLAAAVYGKVDIAAYVYWEEIGGSWDGCGVWGASVQEIDKLWYLAGCRLSDKFKMLCRWNLKFGEKKERYDYHSIIRVVRKSHSLKQTFHILKGLWFIENRNNLNCYINSPKKLEILGRVSLPLRYALLEGASYDNNQLNFEYAAKVQHWTKKEKSKLLSPKEAWYFLYRRCPFQNLENLSIPHPFVLSSWRKGAGAFAKLTNQFGKTEDGTIKQDMILPIFNLCCLYGSENEINKAVFNSTAKGIHDAGQFVLPTDKNWNPKNWKGFVQKYPEALKFTQLFSRIESNGILPKSMAQLKELCSKFVYDGSVGFDELAKWCNNFNLSQDSFEKYKNLYGVEKKAESCPFVDVVSGKYRLYKLAYNDVRGPLLGNFTDCCQHLDSAGAACARHGWTDSTSAFYVVEKDSNIIAQSWAWRSKKSDLVFDSIEGLTGYDYNTVANLFFEAAKQIVGRLGINRVLVGNTSYGITANIRSFLQENKISECQNGLSEEMRSRCSYMDGADQWQLYKDGKPKKFKKKDFVKSSCNFTVNEYANNSDVYCEHCDAQVHPDCEICPACNENIAEWV